MHAVGWIICLVIPRLCIVYHGWIICHCNHVTLRTQNLWLTASKSFRAWRGPAPPAPGATPCRPSSAGPAPRCTAPAAPASCALGGGSIQRIQRTGERCLARIQRNMGKLLWLVLAPLKCSQTKGPARSTSENSYENGPKAMVKSATKKSRF